ncbi:metallophosphoesterase [Dyadobacter luticola]|uniref:T9SS type A sorting domain-containing protein n=1 Tax=Dyadobacter luticola TaxID=1979387 RepID=A0A5R9L3Z8_9BACT|nr:metallophosphoesterase [Dyadobacter luticola]TLV03107.1 T9SS type A sorting domain-containing protein [Dyadobacter luticola]
MRITLHSIHCYTHKKLAISLLMLIVCYLPGYAVPSVIRGPYLQAATPTSIVIRWRTDEACDSRVKLGSSVGGLTQIVDDANSVTEHEVKVTGLTANTKYFYSIGTSQTVLQGNPDNFFQTLPLPGTIQKYRIGVLGDCGNNSVNQINTRDQLINYLGNNYLNAWILLGDNAYSFGNDGEFQSNFFNIYKDNFLRRSPVYPAPGNHDYADNPTRQDTHVMPYYDIFTMPKSGEAGGVASNTEAYYSFDYGNIHFLSLDSYGREDNASRLYDTLGKQVKWIKQDLAANKNKDWVVAYWHHPPYTKGSHNSDTESELVKIRTDFIRILERNGVDLILCGHSHDYERSKLMQGHYGLENSFDPAVHNLSNSTGKYDGTPDSCPYEKTSAKNQGTVYVVSGSAGQLSGSQANYPHDGMPFSDATHGGSMLLEVEGNRLDAKWIGADGAIRDQFTLAKDVNVKKNITIVEGKNATLTSSYIGSYQWSTGGNTRSITVSPNVTTDYIVKDGKSCLADTFHVTVSPPLPIRLVSFDGMANENNQVKIHWITNFEENAAHYLIERAADGKSFTEVGLIQAVGNSSKDITYSFIDSLAATFPVDRFYYRLKQVDEDGRFMYSQMIVVKLNTDFPAFNLQLMPNPANGNDITLMLSASEKVNGTLEVYDISGKQIFKEALSITQSTKLPFRKVLQPGTYLFRFRSDLHMITRKLVVH